MERINSITIKIKELKGVNWLATHAYPEGSTVKCERCGIKRPCTTSEVANWIVSGLPRCKRCKGLVTLVNPWTGRDTI